MENTQNGNGMDEKLKKFSSPTHPQEIEWKIQSCCKDKPSALVVPYVNKMAAVKRLDKCFGAFYWYNKMDRPLRGDGFICSIGLQDEEKFIEKTDAGADTNFEAFKGGASDSFKRAAKLWGFGRDLDSYPKIYIETDKPGFGFITDNQKKQLNQIALLIKEGKEVQKFYKLPK